jgi:hypothetical protein
MFRAGGCTVIRQTPTASNLPGMGFGGCRIHDPVGNPIELWQPSTAAGST